MDFLRKSYDSERLEELRLKAQEAAKGLENVDREILIIEEHRSKMEDNGESEVEEDLFFDVMTDFFNWGSERKEVFDKELEENLIICQAEEMVDRLAEYAEAGLDEIILSSNLGQPQSEHLEAMERFAIEVLPHLQQVAFAA